MKKILLLIVGSILLVLFLGECKGCPGDVKETLFEIIIENTGEVPIEATVTVTEMSGNKSADIEPGNEESFAFIWELREYSATHLFVFDLQAKADESNIQTKQVRMAGGDPPYRWQVSFAAPEKKDTEPPVWEDERVITDASCPGSGQLKVQWRKATDADSPPVTYLVYISRSNTPWNTTPVEIPAGQRSYTFNNLGNHSFYNVCVRARDSAKPPNTDQNTYRVRVYVR